MIKLTHAVNAWGSPSFNEVFKAEVEQLPATELPLQQGLSLSSYVSAEPFRVMVLHAEDEGSEVRVKAGIFYTGIIAGCSCSDDPTPTDLQQEYCDVLFALDKETGAATLTLLAY